MRIVLCFILFACLPAWALAQAPTPRALDADDPCPVALPDWATPSETYAWDRICAGRIADMSFATGAYDGAGCDARDQDRNWPDERRLSARFVKLIATRAPYFDAPARPAVRIRCARVPDRIVLSDETVPQTLWLDDSRLPQGLALVDTRFGGDLSLDGSALAQGSLTADGLSVRGDLFLRNGQFAAVNLIGARVDGDLSTIGSRFTGLFTADGLTVTGDLYLRGGAEFAEVRLLSARVGGDLDAIGSRFTGPFTADRLTVAGGLYLRGGAEFAEVRLLSARVGGHFQMQNSTFREAVDLSDASLGALLLWRGQEDVTWGADATLILRNVEAGVLQARMPQSWRRDDGTPLPVDLAGFRYDRLGGLGSGAAHDLSRVDAGALITWVEGPLPGGMDPDAGYAPQPYRQLAETLRAMGAEQQADAVAYARHLHRARSRPDTPQGWLAWTGDQVLRGLAGFGIYPFRVLWWFAGLVLLGTLIARRAPPLSTRSGLDCFWYSLENALPLVEASDDHKAILLTGPRTRSFFHFQKVAGFALATILVGALTLLGG